MGQVLGAGLFPLKPCLLLTVFLTALASCFISPGLAFLICNGKNDDTQPTGLFSEWNDLMYGKYLEEHLPLVSSQLRFCVRL